MDKQRLSRTEMTDDELVDGYAQGNILCFDELLNRYEKKLFNYIYRLVNQRQEAEDIFQDVFSRVIGNIQRYRQNGKFKAWLFTIALNRYRDLIRRRGKVNLVSLNHEVSGREDGRAYSLESVIAQDAPSASVEAENKERERLLKGAISSLPEKLKEVLTLRVYGELSFKEIGQVLGCPINTALGRMQYALNHLRKILKEKGLSDELR